jgi:hypothetical protein
MRGNYTDLQQAAAGGGGVVTEIARLGAGLPTAQRSKNIAGGRAPFLRGDTPGKRIPFPTHPEGMPELNSRNALPLPTFAPNHIPTICNGARVFNPQPATQIRNAQRSMRGNYTGLQEAEIPTAERSPRLDILALTPTVKRSKNIAGSRAPFLRSDTPGKRIPFPVHPEGMPEHKISKCTSAPNIAPNHIPAIWSEDATRSPQLKSDPHHLSTRSNSCANLTPFTPPFFIRLPKSYPCRVAGLLSSVKLRLDVWQ